MKACRAWGFENLTPVGRLKSKAANSNSKAANSNLLLAQRVELGASCLHSLANSEWRHFGTKSRSRARTYARASPKFTHSTVILHLLCCKKTYSIKKQALVENSQGDSKFSTGSKNSSAQRNFGHTHVPIFRRKRFKKAKHLWAFIFAVTVADGFAGFAWGRRFLRKRRGLNGE